MTVEERGPALETHVSEAPEPLVVFVHIRKTAGLSLRHILFRQYRRRRTRIVFNYFNRPQECIDQVRALAASRPPELRAAHGHMLFWPEIGWPEDTRFVTLLRDPVERTISHYYWILSKNPNFGKSLHEAVADGQLLDNMQTRVLAASTDPSGETTDDTLERAIENLSRFSVVGLTERFDESLVLMTRALGWRRMLYRRGNVTPGRKAQDEIAAETLAVIEERNALDLELYRRAQGLFEEQLDRQGDDFSIEVEALRRANARLDGDVGPLPSTVGGGDASLELRECLVDAQAELLICDWELERLGGITGHSGARPALYGPD